MASNNSFVIIMPFDFDKLSIFFITGKIELDSERSIAMYL